MSLGFNELLVVFIIALLVFGPKKLPEVGRSLGKALQELRRASNEVKASLDQEEETDISNAEATNTDKGSA